MTSNQFAVEHWKKEIRWKKAVLDEICEHAREVAQELYLMEENLKLCESTERALEAGKILAQAIKETRKQ